MWSAIRYKYLLTAYGESLILKTRAEEVVNVEGRLGIYATFLFRSYFPASLFLDTRFSRTFPRFSSTAHPPLTTPHIAVYIQTLTKCQSPGTLRVTQRYAYNVHNEVPSCSQLETNRCFPSSWWPLLPPVSRPSTMKQSQNTWAKVCGPWLVFA